MTAVGVPLTCPMTGPLRAISMSTTHHPANGGPAEGYSVFGQLYEGFEVLDDIAGVKTDRRDAPYEDVIIESVTIEKA